MRRHLSKCFQKFSIKLSEDFLCRLSVTDDAERSEGSFRKLNLNSHQLPRTLCACLRISNHMTIIEKRFSPLSFANKRIEQKEKKSLVGFKIHIRLSQRRFSAESCSSFQLQSLPAETKFNFKTKMKNFSPPFYTQIIFQSFSIKTFNR